MASLNIFPWLHLFLYIVACGNSLKSYSAINQYLSANARVCVYFEMLKLFSGVVRLPWRSADGVTSAWLSQLAPGSELQGEPLPVGDITITAEPGQRRGQTWRSRCCRRIRSVALFIHVFIRLASNGRTPRLLRGRCTIIIDGFSFLGMGCQRPVRKLARSTSTAARTWLRVREGRTSWAASGGDTTGWSRWRREGGRVTSEY